MPNRREILKTALLLPTASQILRQVAEIDDPKAAMSEEEPIIHYLNTDLDLISVEDLTPLGAALEARGVSPLHIGRLEDGFWYATFETDEGFEEPEPNIDALLTAIRSLDAPERTIWKACIERCCDIGYDCGKTPWPFKQNISPAVLRGMAEEEISLRITIYPVEPPGGVVCVTSP